MTHSNRFSERLYLDQAATSWPKITAVARAVEECIQTQGATAGRGIYESSRQSQRYVDQARFALAKLIGAPSPDSIALLTSGTHALNEAIQGVLRPGDHVIATAVEHNSVLRPLERLRKSGGIDLDIVRCDATGFVQPSHIYDRLNATTKLIVLCHASNVTGTLQAVEEVGKWARSHDLIFLVDAAQTLGYLPIDVEKICADYLAAPAHKGLGGLLGTGLLYASERCQKMHQPLIVGGTGSFSEELDPDLPWPVKVEAGNLNLPGIVSVAVAAEYLIQQDLTHRHRNLMKRGQLCRDLLESYSSIRTYGVKDYSQQVGVLSWRHASLSPTELAAILDSEFHIEARAGFHCAALIHPYLGTADEGTVRFSFSPEDSSCDHPSLTTAIQALGEIV